MRDLTRQFIYLCWAIFLAYWFVASFSVKRRAEKEGWERLIWRLPMIVASVLVLLLVQASGEPGHSILWQRTLVEDIIADAVTLAGLVITIWARRTIGRNWSGSIDLKEDHELIERGPYAYVRHPIYSGLLLMGLGSLILYPWVGGFILLVGIFLSFWIKLRREERFLTRHFPEEYPRYKARTKALIPYVF